ncbi:MAG TPA: glycosyltransferase, partial [Gemmataceae bacterium]|nr:glycosyltransferase [Gemmataceae bacterium]
IPEVLAASDLHVYLSRPYPIGRSLLEALAAGCVVMATDTAPVREVITDGRDGFLVAPGQPDQLAKLALAVLANPAEYRALGMAAAQTARERWARDVNLPRLARWLSGLVE